MPLAPRLLSLLLASAVTLAAEVTPHPTQPDRLVDTRGDLSVEYSPGQEVWAELAFAKLAETESLPPLPEPSAAEPLAGSARDLRLRRDAYLAAIAQQIGLSAPTELQTRTYDTFLGYYELMDQVFRTAITRRDLIRRPDRRWLCDGTANYVAWRVARDLVDPDFAREGYDLDAQLRRYATLQQQIHLSRWSATENQTAADQDSELNQAHYAFATRAIFILTTTHGEDALAQLWRDVAAVGIERASAQTFATALRRRYPGGNLTKLIRAAETRPIPPARVPAP